MCEKTYDSTLKQWVGDLNLSFGVIEISEAHSTSVMPVSVDAAHETLWIITPVSCASLDTCSAVTHDRS